MSLLILFLFLLCFFVSDESVALDCDSGRVWKTISVSKSGHGDFTSVQAAIDSIPANNNKWIKIQVSRGTFGEKVDIPVDKPCIYLEGAGIRDTTIAWGAYGQTDTSATFTVSPDNFVAKNIGFMNTYMIAGKQRQENMTWALAVRLYGDKYAFYNCGFIGLQDTIWDVSRRHYFKDCYIEGGVDFIFGGGQSIYENCNINMTIGIYAPDYPNGYVTAQGRNSPEDPSGFVFKGCNVQGTGKTYLGRAWGAYSRVIFYQSQLSDIVLPAGWDAWDHASHEGSLMYTEAENTGPGANMAQRVPWLKKLSEVELGRFVNLQWINQDGWISKLPAGLSV